MTGAYSSWDVKASYSWLGHRRGYTELNAFDHPFYRPGRENLEWNRDHNAFPKVAYARNEHDVMLFVRAYAGSRTVCFSINPREHAYTNRYGYPRSALEAEVLISQNALLDIDVHHTALTPALIAAFEVFLDRTDEFLSSYGCLPVRCFSGRGYNLGLAFPPITTEECPDIAARLAVFRNQFAHAFSQDLADLGASVDHCHDLRRLWRIPGTAKVSIGIKSKFYGNGERNESEQFRQYLLQLKPPTIAHSQAIELRVRNELPAWFPALLEQDQRVRDLWHGRGKTDGDVSRSGYDFSLATRLARLGYPPDQIGSILRLRPDGAVKASGKRDDYVKRTITKAITG